MRFLPSILLTTIILVVSSSTTFLDAFQPLSKPFSSRQSSFVVSGKAQSSSLRPPSLSLYSSNGQNKKIQVIDIETNNDVSVDDFESLRLERQTTTAATFDPVMTEDEENATNISRNEMAVKATSGLGITAALLSLPMLVDRNAITAIAAPILNNDLFAGLSQGNLNPATFQPVCAASDQFYRLLQQVTVAVVGRENFVEYGPLIAGGLLRVRLELCVVESFFNEAVGPFIAENGISWILPLHETVETFLAGGIFAVATTFILIGSTKLLTVVATYTDFLFGLPSRLIGGFIFDRASGKPVTLDLSLGPWSTRVIGPPKPKEGEVIKDEFSIKVTSLPNFVIITISGIIKVIGETLGFIRDLLEKFDYFVGRYLVLGASFYVLIKFLHFKIFPDFP